MSKETSAKAGTTPTPVNRYIYLIAGISGLGGLLFGYDTGNIAVGLLSLSDHFQMSLELQGIVVSTLAVGAIVGSLTAGTLSDKFGRKRIVLIVAVLFALGALGQGLSPNVATLIGFRFILGFAAGSSCSLIPVYVAELAPARVRGAATVFFQFMVGTGQLIAYVTGFVLHDFGGWRAIFVLGAIPATVLFAGMLFLPETPRLLMRKGDEAAARSVLRKVRNLKEDVGPELAEIRNISQQEDTGGIRDIGKRWARPAIVIGVLISAFAQLTGIDAVVTYAPTILTDAGFGESASIITSIGVGAMLVCGAGVGILTVDKIGRRRIMLLMLPGSALSIAVLGLTFLNQTIAGGTQWIVVVSLLAYIFFNGASIQVAVWLIGPEIFPLAVRGASMSLASATVWGFNFVVTFSTLIVIEWIGRPAFFLGLSAVTIVCWLFVYVWLPETKGKTLEQVEQALLKPGSFRANLASSPARDFEEKSQQRRPSSPRPSGFQ